MAWIFGRVTTRPTRPVPPSLYRRHAGFIKVQIFYIAKSTRLKRIHSIVEYVIYSLATPSPMKNRIGETCYDEVLFHLPRNFWRVNHSGDMWVECCCMCKLWIRRAQILMLVYHCNSMDSVDQISAMFTFEEVYGCIEDIQQKDCQQRQNAEYNEVV